MAGPEGRPTRAGLRIGPGLALTYSVMDEQDPRSTPRHADDQPAKPRIKTADTAPRPTILWRMRSASLDNQASCSVTEDEHGCHVLVVFAKGLGVPEHFADVTAAMRHSMEIAGRLTAQGWVDVDLSD